MLVRHNYRNRLKRLSLVLFRQFSESAGQKIPKEYQQCANSNSFAAAFVETLSDEDERLNLETVVLCSAPR
jgi:hypothetical protein